jgi:protein tyrosine/serine phosphatase
MKLQDISLFRVERIKSRSVMSAVLILTLTLSLAGATDAAFDGSKYRRDAVVRCDVKNFGKVNDHIYRGGQPEDDEYEQLAALGIKTVIDLREDPERYARRAAQSAGLQYINIRLNSKRPPTTQESDQFLQLVNDQNNWPVFAHCAGGRHRTGVLLAVYRMEMDGWNARQAYAEMKDFKFYSNWGHGDMKDYVFDYYNRMLAKRGAPASRARKVTEAGQDN